MKDAIKKIKEIIEKIIEKIFGNSSEETQCEKEIKNEEIVISEAIIMLKDFILKNKKIILNVFAATVVLSILLSVKSYNAGKYIIAEVQLPFLIETKGKNFDGTKFDEKFLIAGDTRLEIEPVLIPESVERKIISKDKTMKLEEVDVLLVKNIEEYIEKQLPKDQLIKYIPQKERLVKNRSGGQKEDEYRTRVNLFNYYSNSIEKVYMKIETSYDETQKKVLAKSIDNIRIEIKKYEDNVTTKNIYSSKEDINSYFDKMITNKKDENSIIQMDIKVIKEIVDTLNNSNQQIPLSFKIGNRTYENILGEYTYLILKYNTNIKYMEQQNIQRDKVLKEMISPSEQEKITIGKQEEKITNMINTFIKKNNGLINKAIKQKGKDAIKVSKARVESSGKPFELMLIGVFLGVVFGCIVAALKDLYEELKGKKEEEEK